MSFAKGLLRPDPAKLARRLHASLHPALAKLGVPVGAADLQTCPVLDQGPSGTCHAHSAAGAIWTAFQAAGKPLGFIPSPRLIASCTYADVQGPASKRGPLLDTGADLSDDATAVGTWGIGPMRGPASDGRNSDVEAVPSSGVFPEPDVSQLVVAGADLISGEYSIPVDSNAPIRCALALDAKIPIWLGFFCDSAFEQLGPNDVAGVPDMSDPNGGGHAVYLHRYRQQGSALQYRVQNSWGSSWCDNGGVWVSEAWLMACWVLWPMAVVS